MAAGCDREFTLRRRPEYKLAEAALQGLSSPILRASAMKYKVSSQKTKTILKVIAKASQGLGNTNIETTIFDVGNNAVRKKLRNFLLPLSLL